MIRDTGTHVALKHSPKRRTESGNIAEYYNALLRNLRLHTNRGHQRSQSIGVASIPGCGRTSVVATNLAICLSNADDSDVILVNADPRNRVAEVTFSLDADNGIYDVMRGDGSPTDAIQDTHIRNLKAVSCGRFEKGFESFSCLMKFGDVLEVFKDNGATVILDLPSASELTPCFDMAACLDGIVLEVEASNVKRNVATRTLEQLRFADANVLGCVFKQA